MTDFGGLLRRLVDAEVEFILVGGVAATAHGSARLTSDIDIVYARTSGNIRNVVIALSGLHPYPRGAPAGLPFKWDAETVSRGLNFTLTTQLGSIDLLGEIASEGKSGSSGGGTYPSLLPHTIELVIHGFPHRCLDLDTLIQVKRAAGRIKDFEAIAELEAIREELVQDNMQRANDSAIE